MSAFGSFEACNTVCQCHDCILIGVWCWPCMDCVGEADDSESAKEEYCNGYIRIGEKCPSKEEELKRYLKQKQLGRV